LDFEAMRHALKRIEGTHDFTSFCSVHSVAKSHVRTVYETRLEWLPASDGVHEGTGCIRLYITGNGFLYNMVRIIVGTVIEIGEGKRNANEIETILQGRDRSLAGPTAMAHGLMLWSVEYT